MMMQWISRIMLIAMVAAPVLVIGASGAAGADNAPARFVSTIEDLPLMDAMGEMGDGVRFESDQGRIAEASAQGRVSLGAARAFYAQTLPQLGWSRVSDERYMREGEVLSLSFKELDGTDSGLLRINFSIKPR